MTNCKTLYELKHKNKKPIQFTHMFLNGELCNNTFLEPSDWENVLLIAKDGDFDIMLAFDNWEDLIGKTNNWEDLIGKTNKKALLYYGHWNDGVV